MTCTSCMSDCPLISYHQLANSWPSHGCESVGWVGYESHFPAGGSLSGKLLELCNSILLVIDSPRLSMCVCVICNDL